MSIVDTIGVAPPADAADASVQDERTHPEPPLDVGTPPSEPGPDRYRPVLGVLSVLALVGAYAGLHDARALGDKAVLDAAVALGIAGGMLLGVIVTRLERARRSGGVAVAGSAPDRTERAAPPDADAVAPIEPALASDAQPLEPPPDAGRGLAASPPSTNGSAHSDVPAQPSWTLRRQIMRRVDNAASRLELWYHGLTASDHVRLMTGAAAAIATLIVLRGTFYPEPETALIVWLAAGAYLLAAGLAATAARYLGELEEDVLPEARGLASGGRVLAWILAAGAVSIALDATGGADGVRRVLHLTLAVLDLAICWGLLRARPPRPGVFPTQLPIFEAFGRRWNPLASVVDTAERRLGIDLRSTWALTVVRQSTEPLLIGLALLFWLSTSLTVVGVSEQALVERLGVPVAGAPLGPGIYLRWPWPIDRVYRIPVGQVRAIQIGHEGEEAGGPENVLWAVQHAPNEFTLLLGNGRDLVTIDAAVQYRIVDPRAWRYHSTNPEEALKALGYRAVMRNTVDKTLADVLSQNVVVMTDRMRSMVQSEADALGLGVSIVGFTVGGMHPPVPVAQSYEAVVSAQIARTTRVVNAQAYRNQIVPGAESEALRQTSTARAGGAEDLARAAGEAWSFRTLEAQYRASPAEYSFRRRLETLEQDLDGKTYTIVDSRFLRDGGELWVDR